MTKYAKALECNYRWSIDGGTTRRRIRVKSETPVKCVKFATGAQVMAMWKEGRRPEYSGWYLATVTAANDDGTFALQYDDGYKDRRVRDQYIRQATDSEIADGERGNGAPFSIQPKYVKARFGKCLFFKSTILKFYEYRWSL